jgi:hypothetical protein
MEPSSSVGIATGYGLDGPGLIPGNAKFFSSQPSDGLRGPPSFQLVPGALFVWDKAAGA